MRQADVVTAYLNADMPDEVYIKLPKICGDDPNMVRRLCKHCMDILKLGNCGIMTLWDLLAMKVLLQRHVTGAFSSDLNHTSYWCCMLMTF